MNARPLAAAVVVAVVALAGCDDALRTHAAGDPGNGRLLLRQFGCGDCHVIAGVAAAQGQVGPPLTGVAHRVYLAGRLPNTPDNMVRFIRAPHAVDPRTAMPDLQVTERHARDMTAYLHSLR
jgi:cytochrome c2